MQKQNRTEARKMALEVLAEDPDQAVALSVLGMIALEKKEFAEAIENLEKANRLTPSGYRAGRLARAYELNGKPLKALEVLDEALRQNPRDGFLLRQYNSLRDKTTDQARIADNSDNLALSPKSDIDEDDHLPYAEQIRAKLQNLDAAEAVKQLEKLIKIGKRKNNPYLHLLHGDLLREAGDEEAAMQAYSRARELDPQNMIALSQLLFSLRRLERKEEAWPLLKLLLYHRPGDVTAKSSLIKDALSLGKEKETLLFFEELLHKYPERKELYGTIRKLHNAVTRKEGNS
jgi:predicted Zn-dependent protease